MELGLSWSGHVKDLSGFLGSIISKGVLLRTSALLWKVGIAFNGKSVTSHNLILVILNLGYVQLKFYKSK